jgi:hypothetical protein
MSGRVWQRVFPHPRGKAASHRTYSDFRRVLKAEVHILQLSRGRRLKALIVPPWTTLKAAVGSHQRVDA